ncbi:hypothetical protein [Mycoplasma nasistruthionis]|uniref:Lipoprotein n=1 Tax=Mycoplasma nasistruthionis TaxID=353852 RepID=A0A5B7XVR1_9MOLU|nr:hypothetical protein [Mycoplasma nasistruthionis]QCZ36906.1 hypothetical protein FG904_02735 [Mycoplasma nasistruthionis]
MKRIFKFSWTLLLGCLIPLSCQNNSNLENNKNVKTTYLNSINKNQQIELNNLLKHITEPKKSNYTKNTELLLLINSHKNAIKTFKDTLEYKSFSWNEQATISNILDNSVLLNIIKMNLYSIYLMQYQTYHNFIMYRNYVPIFNQSQYDIAITENNEEYEKYTDPFNKHNSDNKSIGKDIEFNPEFNIAENVYKLYYNFNASNESLSYLYNLEKAFSLNNPNWKNNKKFKSLNQIVDNSKLISDTLNWNNKTLKLWSYHGLMPSFKGYKINSEGNKNNYYISLNIPKNQINNFGNYLIRINKEEKEILKQGSEVETHFESNYINFAYLPKLKTFEEYSHFIETKLKQIDLSNWLIKDRWTVNQNYFELPSDFRNKLNSLLQEFNDANSQGQALSLNLWLALYTANTFDLDFWNDIEESKKLLLNDYDNTEDEKVVLNIKLPKSDKQQLFIINSVNINNFSLKKQQDLIWNEAVWPQMDSIENEFNWNYDINKPVVILQPSFVHPFNNPFWGYSKQQYKPHFENIQDLNNPYYGTERYGFDDLENIYIEE